MITFTVNLVFVLGVSATCVTAAAEQIPDSVDWRAKGVVPPVRSQGQCGNSALMALLSATEAAWAVASGKLIPLSMPQLTECSDQSAPHPDPNCGGGSAVDAVKYLLKNGGLDSDADYGPGNGTCKKDKEENIVAKIVGYEQIPARDEKKLAIAVAKQPVIVMVEADEIAFQSYTGGIFDGRCGTRIDHELLVVGYEPKYWICQNSWGAAWGDDGYIYIARGVGGDGGECGITLDASYPVAGSPNSAEDAIDFNVDPSGPHMVQA